MKIGESKITKMLLSMIGSDGILNINDYINDVSYENFYDFSSINQVDTIFRTSVNNFVESLSEEELMNLRSWTGYNFRNINAILRGKWSYDVNGRLTDEKKVEYRKLAYMIGKIIQKFEMPDINFITFRGVTIDAFSDYNISNLSELTSLNGKFLFEQGFISTSMLEDTSYFNKDVNDGKNYNIKIKYLVSSEFDDGILLIDNNISYSINQNEYLINKDSLSKVIDVKIDENNNTAMLTVILIPSKVWSLENDRNINKSMNK